MTRPSKLIPGELYIAPRFLTVERPFDSPNPMGGWRVGYLSNDNQTDCYIMYIEELDKERKRWKRWKFLFEGEFVYLDKHSLSVLVKGQGEHIPKNGG